VEAKLKDFYDDLMKEQKGKLKIFAD